jgi:hypothetical protein
MVIKQRLTSIDNISMLCLEVENQVTHQIPTDKTSKSISPVKFKIRVLSEAAVCWGLQERILS